MKEEHLFDFLRTNYYHDLIKSPGIYDTFDCYSERAGIYAELKCRRTHYDNLLIEKVKWDNLVLDAHSRDLEPWYINSTPEGIWAFHLQSEFEPAWESKQMPVTTDFANNNWVSKVVGFLPTSLGKVMYANLPLQM